jgi:dTDP-glucose 4,6-dehydratase
MKTILITGGAGFIGSNFIRYIIKKYLNYKIINLDLLTYAGNTDNLSDIDLTSNYIFIKGDIRNAELVNQIFKKYDINTVINFAAESHVDRSIFCPEVFVNTNVIGTYILLEEAKKAWKYNYKNNQCTKYKNGVKFIQISTDEVYGSLGSNGYFKETTPIKPNSPYSASKASADLFVRAFNKTYGLPVNITRCSNNYGPFQYAEKLIPMIIMKCLSEKRIPIYGDGLQVRDWLHVYDHCSAIDLVLHKGDSGEVYNIGGNNEKTNINIAKLILGYLNKNENLLEYIEDRPGHDRRYAIDSTKIKTDLGWKQTFPFEKGINETIEWYTDNFNRIKKNI